MLKDLDRTYKNAINGKYKTVTINDAVHLATALLTDFVSDTVQVILEKAKIEDDNQMGRSATI